MTKFQKIQIFSSIIPFYSSYFVFFTTMVVLKKKKATIQFWMKFGLITVTAVFAVSFLDHVLTLIGFEKISWIVVGVVLAAANVCCVFLQRDSDSTEANPTKTLNMKAFLIIIGVLVSMSCFIVIKSTIPSSDIADTNGEENTKLTVITMEDICAKGNGYSSQMSKTRQSGGRTDTPEELRDYDSDHVLFECKKINGVKTIHATKTADPDLTLEVETQLMSGNMEVLILVDDQYYDDIEVNKKQTITLHDVSNKTVVIKIGAESAQMRISITRKTLEE